MMRALSPEDLFQLQAGQYARDTHAGALPHRVKMLTLQFAAHACLLTETRIRGDDAARGKALCEMFAGVLSCANALNVDLRRASYPVSAPPDYIRLWGPVGAMAKACEALDHLENYPAREKLEAGVIALAQMIMARARAENLDLKTALSKRPITRPACPGTG